MFFVILNYENIGRFLLETPDLQDSPPQTETRVYTAIECAILEPQRERERNK